MAKIRNTESLTMHARPARPRRESRGPSALRLRQVSARMRRRSGSAPPVRPSLFGFSQAVLQRSIVKVRYVQNRGGSGWRGHGRYLAREGAQQEGRPGQGFDAHETEIDIAGRLGRWQRAGDPRLWKLIVSPEAGERLDLRAHARELVAAMEGDLGLRLEWVGIEHFDTAHPHVHVVIRGRGEKGNVFRMPREYVTHGLRQRSQEIATQTLGLRLDRDRLAGRERAVEVRHFGLLDQMLERQADPQRRIEFEAAAPSEEASRTLRLQLLRRLGFLSGLGLARRVGKHSYELSEHHRAALEQMQLVRDLQRSLTLFGEPLVDPSATHHFTELLPGVELRGGVVGGGEDEDGGRVFLIVESMDGTVHFVLQTPEIEALRDRDELVRGEVVTFRATAAPPESERSVVVEVTQHGRLSELEAATEPSTVLDLVAVQTVRENGGTLPADRAVHGFGARLRHAIERRLPLLEERGILHGVEEERGGERVRRLAIALDAEERIARAMKERDRGLTPLSEVERTYGKSVVHARLEPGLTYEGRVVAMASNDDGSTYAVLKTDPTLTAVPAKPQELRVGQEIRAVAVAHEVAGERRWVLAWRLDDLGREQKHDRGRER